MWYEIDSHSGNQSPPGTPPFHLQLEAETKAGIYRLDCNYQWKSKTEGFGHAFMTWNMEKEPIIRMGADETIPRYAYDKSFTGWLPDRYEWKYSLRTCGILPHGDVATSHKAMDSSH
jgi:hypothetical protein